MNFAYQRTNLFSSAFELVCLFEANDQFCLVHESLFFKRLQIFIT